MAEEVAPVIGIDLGTTYSSVGVFENGRVKIIANENGYRITPSYVTFTETGHIVGDDAKYSLTMKPKQTVFEVKRIIGRPFSDATADMEKWPFEVLDDNDQPKIVVYPGGSNPRQVYTPEMISAKILIAMKAIAEKYLKKVVKKAVITVPAYFNHSQRKATKTAGEIAGLEVMRIINEPEAAAMAFNQENKSENERKVLVYDLGGGTFDVSVLVIDGGTIEVLAKLGDTHLGGSDFDNAMVTYCLDWFNSKQHPFSQVPVLATSRPYNRLRRACEFAKCRLSQENETLIRVEKFHEHEDFNLEISRGIFEELNYDLIEKTMTIVKEVLKDARITSSAIDEILLVGGSTRIPIIQEKLRNIFRGKTLNKSINPDEAVAYGAAIQAAILEGNDNEELEDILLMDVTPLSLGVGIKGNIMSDVIKRNTLIPFKNTETYVTCNDDQTSMQFNIYQGERTMVKHNHKMTSFDINNLPSAPAGVARVHLTFEINADGILDVIAEDRVSGNEEYITVDNCIGQLSEGEVAQLISDAEANKNEDAQERSKIIARNDLESLAIWMARMIKDCRTSLLRKTNSQRVGVIEKECQEIISWLCTSQNSSKDEYHRKRQRLLMMCDCLPSDYKTPGTLPQELADKYKTHGDEISMLSFHNINLDLD